MGTHPSPVGTGPPTLASPLGTRSPPPCATWGPPSLAEAVSPPTVPGPGPLPPASPPRMGFPADPPGSESPDSTCRAEPLPPPSTPGLGPPSSPPCQPPPGTKEAVTLPPPNHSGTSQDEDGPPLDTFPLPSPSAWGSPGLLVGPGEGVPSPRGGSPLPGLTPAPMPQARTPPRSPSPPSLPQDRAPPQLASQEPQPGGWLGPLSWCLGGSRTPNPCPGTGLAWGSACPSPYRVRGATRAGAIPGRFGIQWHQGP